MSHTKSAFVKLYESTLTEINATDQWGKGFGEFLAKYSKPAMRNDRSLYVNFSNHGDNTMDKSFAPEGKIDHSDFQGMYGYRMKYAVENQADIRYGISATYLRVLKVRDINILDLQTLRDSEMEQMFRAEMGEWFSDNVNMLKKYYNNTNVKAVWFRAMQMEKGQLEKIADYMKAKKRNPYGGVQSPEIKLKSGKAQSDMFIKMGYKAILDTASNAAKAIINDREPEQIVFLTKDAFTIVDSFMIRGVNQKDPAKHRHIVTMNTEHEKSLTRKIASGIAVGIGDKLMSERALTTNMNGAQVYFTNLGKTIGVHFVTPESYYASKKFGEKKHKEFKKANQLRVEIYIISEKETVRTNSWEDESFDDIIESTVAAWKAEEKLNPNFVKVRSGKEMEDLMKKRNAAAQAAKMAASINQYIDNDPNGKDILAQKELTAHYGVFFPTEPTKSESFLYEYMTYLGLNWGRMYDDLPDEHQRLLSLDKIPAYILDSGDVSEKAMHGALDLRSKILVQLWAEHYDGKSGYQNWKGDVRDYYATQILLKYLKEKAK